MAQHALGANNNDSLKEDFENGEQTTPQPTPHQPHSAASAGSGSDPAEDVDAVDGAPETDKQVHQLQTKIQKTMDQIRFEQAAKEENVNEYLRVSTAPDYDKQQMQKIKALFERKNLKSTQMLSQYQKKLDGYKRKLKEIQTPGSVSAKQPTTHKQALRQGLKDIKGGISGFSGGVVDNIRGAKDSIVSKPKEFAHLIKNKYKFGSADNINAMKLEEEERDEADKRSHPGSANALLPSTYTKMPSEEEACSDVSGSGVSNGNYSSPNPQSVTAFQSDHQDSAVLEAILRELQSLQDGQQRLTESMDALRSVHQSELDCIKHLLEECRERQDRLEEQHSELFEGHHDFTELHQNEITNIKQELSSIEEKMEYQLEERTRDMQELLESCQTRITKMELQQQQQQIISMEGFENSNFRALFTKVINVVLALLAVIFLLLSTLANFVSPFLTTRWRIMSTFVLVVSSLVAWHHWDFVKEHWQELSAQCQLWISKYYNS